MKYDLFIRRIELKFVHSTFEFKTLEDKLTKGLILTGEFIGDDDSGLEIDTDAIELEEMIIDTDKLHLNLKVFNSITIEN